VAFSLSPDNAWSAAALGVESGGQGFDVFSLGRFPLSPKTTP
jgi:hypothetical protein